MERAIGGEPYRKVLPTSHNYNIEQSYHLKSFLQFETTDAYTLQQFFVSCSDSSRGRKAGLCLSDTLTTPLSQQHGKSTMYVRPTVGTGGKEPYHLKTAIFGI